MDVYNSSGYGPSVTSKWQTLCFDGDERNYEQWEVRFLGYMVIKKLESVLIPDDPENLPADDAAKNKLAYAELTQFLDPTSLSLVMRDARGDGRKALEILKEHYAGSSKPRIITLYTQLTSMKKLSNETITAYILRAEKASAALKAAGEVVSDSLLIAMSLKGLPDEYKSFVTVVTQSTEEYTFQKYKQGLRNFEETEKSREKKQGDESSVMNFQHLNLRTNNKMKPGTVVCFKCGVQGHKSNVCTSSSSSSKQKPRMWCGHCKSNTHNEKACRKLDKVKKVSDSHENNHTFTFKLEDAKDDFVLKCGGTETFLVDCGATTHVVNKDENFTYVDETFDPEKHYIVLADGTKTNNIAKKKGTVKICIQNKDGDMVSATLENCLYIPSYPQCIFSVQAAAQKGSRVNFHGSSAELISKDGTCFPIMQQGRLYYLCQNSVHAGRSASLETWHKVLGHCNTHDVAKLPGAVNGMKITDHSDFNCETCTLSKQTNTRNKRPDARATSPFELIFTDLSGPIDPVGKDGFKYAMVFTDDYSGCLFTYFLKNKSDSVEATKKFLIDISPYGKIKTLSFHDDVFPSGEVEKMRSDNGGEYIAKEFKDLLKKYSIKHELTCPYSPHQNGTAERSWRTLFEMARGMLLEAKLPKELWTYAVMAATYTRNRCFNQRITQTPYGLITGIKPDVSRLNLFGSICYAYIQEYKKKLDPRSKKGYFVGYDKDSPAYLVFYPETNSVGKHRLVKFTDKLLSAKRNIDDQQILHGGVEEEEEEEAELEEVPEDVQAGGPPINGDRRPKREIRRPQRYNDYVSGVISNTSNRDTTADYVCLMYAPVTYQDAVTSTNSTDWKDAMDEEIASLKLNNTFIVTEMPPDRKVVGGRWVYAIKATEAEPLFKARYVAKGCSQVLGLDYFETFSPTARMESVRTLMQVAIHEEMMVHQMDVKSAYLHAPLECDIYVKQPEGYEQIDADGKVLVWKLQKSLYGLKQSGRNWHGLLREFLLGNEFIQANADPCVYIHIDTAKIILLVWVDDIILATSSSKTMDEVKRMLKGRFHMKDLGPISSFLGIKFIHDNNQISMNQTTYLKNVLKRFGMDTCKPRATPCEMNPSSYDDDEIIDVSTYREMVGSLVYAMTCTRPDLSYVVTKLSQHLSCPNSGDWVMLKHVFRYIQGTLDYCLTFKKSEDFKLSAFCDADWASSCNDRRSITGYCFRLSETGAVVSWKSKKQDSVALSTCEAEYMAISATCQEAVYLNRLLQDLTARSFEPVEIRSDNQGAIALVKNPVKHSRSKHIDIRHHFIREHYHDNRISLDYVPSGENLADPFTKPLPKAKWAMFFKGLFG